MNTPQIIVALDVPDRATLISGLARLPGDIAWFKVGLELFCAEGPDILDPLKTKGKNIFLDLKLHDIPRTVERAVASVAKHGVQLLTVHASGGKEMLKAAAHAAKSTSNGSLRTLAVTVLTSLDQQDLRDAGVARPPQDQAAALAELAYAAGIDGIVCSLHEAARIRNLLGPDALIVTPGIRLPDQAVGDQKRVGSPRDAQLAGASHLVIGRPIMEAADPAAAYAALLADMK